MLLANLSILESKILDALDASAPVGLIGLMIATAASYSSVSVTTRVLVRKGLLARGHFKGGHVFQLTPAAQEAMVAATPEPVCMIGAPRS
jgi:hypothetical protein